MPCNSPTGIRLKDHRKLIHGVVGEQPTHSFVLERLSPSVLDRIAFDNWLRTFLFYFRISCKRSPPFHDCGHILKGIAVIWFFVEVAAPKSSIPYMW